MADNRQRIAEILRKYDELDSEAVWKVQGTPVIYHKTLERIATKAGIRFDAPKVIRAERDEAVMQVTGYILDGERRVREEWSIGEALVGTNYRVSGKQAAYVWAMAEKRAKDRVILKLIELAGYVYSEEENDEFKQSGKDREEAKADEDGVVDHQPPPSDASAVRGSTPSGTEAYSGAARVGQKPEDSVLGKIKANIDRRDRWEAIVEFMQSPRTKEALETQLSQEEAKEATDYALARMGALGWVPENKRPKNDASSRKVVSDDPYHLTNLNVLPTVVAGAISEVKTVQEMEDAIDSVLLDRKVEWSKLPEGVQDKINAVADKRAKFLQKQG